MNCTKCNAEMKTVTIAGTMGTPFYLRHKPSGFLSAEKRSGIECYVCPDCGYIELKAVNPEVFKNI